MSERIFVGDGFYIEDFEPFPLGMSPREYEARKHVYRLLELRGYRATDEDYFSEFQRVYRGLMRWGSRWLIHSGVRFRDTGYSVSERIAYHNRRLESCMENMKGVKA